MQFLHLIPKQSRPGRSRQVGGEVGGYNVSSKQLFPRLKHGIPALANASDQVREGCLLSYSPDWENMAGRTACYVDRILRGAAPGDLPVELATFRLIISFATARALAVTISASLLVRADELIG